MERQSEKKIKMLVMDVDGTMTDGKIYMGPTGESLKVFDIKDGYAIYALLPQMGVKPVVITGRESDIVSKRCDELGITDVFQGCTDKLEKMIEVAASFGLEPDENGILKGVAYIGDDELDIPCMKVCELSGCPDDAVSSVRKTVDYICKSKGGNGAVREFVEWIMDNTCTE